MSHSLCSQAYIPRMDKGGGRWCRTAIDHSVVSVYDIPPPRVTFIDKTWLYQRADECLEVFHQMRVTTDFGLLGKMNQAVLWTMPSPALIDVPRAIK